MRLVPVPLFFAGDPRQAISRAADSSRGTGYVVESLEAALWAFHNSENFHDGALLDVNLGDDADTTGAAFGQLAGAYYGEEGIPERWRELVAKKDLILGLADMLFEHGSGQGRVTK